jgi:7,8-dihydropterin-6-yl-methyl-4-(beta-D-ribofuranosyl)aminobenzene 5'-phosphate synthase
VLDKEKGLIVITGCAHPGIVDILKKAKQMLSDKEIYLVMGGFHLGGFSEVKLESVIEEFKRLGVKKVAPSHCSGELFRELAKQKYKKNFLEGGVGQVISF